MTGTDGTGGDAHPDLWTFAAGFSRPGSHWIFVIGYLTLDIDYWLREIRPFLCGPVTMMRLWGQTVTYVFQKQRGQCVRVGPVFVRPPGAILSCHHARQVDRRPGVRTLSAHHSDAVSASG